MKAVIMAGGEGTRLRPLTTSRPKPLTPALNVPIMEHIIRLLKRHGITEIIVTLHYLADAIQDYFGDGSDFGVSITYSIEDTPLGTAGSVKQAEQHLRRETFLIISGDALTDVDIDQAVAFHKAKKSIATLILASVPTPLSFGVVVADDEGRITRFLEKPSWSEVFSDTVNTGMYLLEPSIFKLMEHGQKYDWSQDIFPRLLEEKKRLYGFVMQNDYWCDVGDLTQYREAQYTVMDRHTRVEVGDTGYAYAEGRWTADDASVDPAAKVIPPVMIGRGCVIKAGAVVGPYSVLGDGAIIEENAHVQRSILWNNVYVGPDARLNACTVCSHVTINANCNIQEGAVIGDGCRLENGATVRNQIKLWPEKIIEAGSTVTMSLVWGQKWQGSLFRHHGVTGIANIELSPDLACKLGAAFGGYLRRGGSVVTSRDSGPVARMLKRALISGLLSVGVNVLDMRSMPLPIARHGIMGSSAGGGVHVRRLPDDPRMAVIEFYDEHGVYLSKDAERKVETIFFREDFRRVDADQCGRLEFAGRSVEEYEEDFRRRLKQDAIRDRSFRVVADFAFGRLAGVYPSMLGHLGCDLVALNAYPDVDKTPKTRDQRAALLPNLAQIVQTLHADIGVLFEADGERLTLVDETGRVIAGSDLLCLFAVLVARTHQRARVAVPVTATRAIESLAHLHGAIITRTRAHVRDLMDAGLGRGAEKADFAGDDAGGFMFPEFQPSLDAMFAFGRLMEMLAVTGLGLGEIGREIPATHVVHAAVPCEWQRKGQLMGALSRAAGAVPAGEPQAQLIDGIKFFEGADWALVLPDAAEPTVHVYAEATTAPAAQKLLGRFVHRVEVARDR